MDWTRMLAYVTGTVDRELLARNEYLAAENRIIKAQLNGRLKLSDADAERIALGEIAHRLGRKVLADVATIARPDTILAGRELNRSAPCVDVESHFRYTHLAIRDGSREILRLCCVDRLSWHIGS